MERSVVAFLRFVIGDWWPDVLEAPRHGMITLPEKFIEKHATTYTDPCRFVKKNILWNKGSENRRVTIPQNQSIREKCYKWIRDIV